jgi:hypothetical protein
MASFECRSSHVRPSELSLGATAQVSVVCIVFIAIVVDKDEGLKPSTHWKTGLGLLKQELHSLLHFPSISKLIHDNVYTLSNSSSCKGETSSSCEVCGFELIPYPLY